MIALVPHEMGSMTMVEYPAHCLGEHVRRINDSRKLNQDDVLHKSPMLQCKISGSFDSTRVGTTGKAVA